MPPLIPEHPGRQYWRSLDQLADTPEFRRFIEAEFPSLAPELNGPSRRTFLKLMGASLALAGVTGCRWPKENLLPLTRQPNNRIPGVAQQFATSFELNGVATGLLVTSVDGRPIKIEGNPEHPFSRGKSDALMQASVLELYDPDRSQQVLELVAGRARADAAGVAIPRTWDEFVGAFITPHVTQSAGGAGLAVLAEPSSSPTRADAQARFLAAYPRAGWYEYTPVSRDNERAATRLAFGAPARPYLKLDRADAILSIDEDFLGSHPAAVRYAGDFAARRRAIDGTMSRLYVVESSLTITGTQADHRLAVPPHEAAAILAGVAAELARAGLVLPGAAEAANTAGGRWPLVARIAQDLRAAGPRALVTVGPQVAPEVAALAHAINHALGSVGATVTYLPEADTDRQPHAAAVAELTRRMSAGEVQTLLILGGNPVYDAPADLGFAAALEKVPQKLHLGLYANETARLCTWHVPQTHFLEAWGDARAWDGTLSLLQPLIEPFYPDSRTPAELLAALSGDALQRSQDLTRRTFDAQFAGNGDAETAWKQAVQLGLVPATATPAAQVTIQTTWQTGLAHALAAPETGSSQYVVTFRPDYKLHDGRFANNGWLQEMPEPITKLTWDNAALLSPRDAAALGVKRNGELLRLEAQGAQLEIAAFILPGQPAGVITVPLGYGRGKAAGVVGAGAGFNAYALRTSETLYARPGVAARALGRTYLLAGTQDHHAIEVNELSKKEAVDRVGELLREMTLATYNAHPEAAKHAVHHLPLLSLWDEKQYGAGHKWGMAIDLAACTGCGACVVACQAENNVPVVGKKEVAEGREMHWLRVDRYFKTEAHGEHEAHGAQDGLAAQAPAEHQPPATPETAGPWDPADLEPSDVRVAHQPMLCVHCELAPCEGVCPVAATVHDAEGLNVMIYNRCIGTRYCSNNCPYKVRRFNWFYNQHGPYHPRSLEAGTSPLPGKLPQAELSPLEALQRNPEVTVRSRGVMEKCTYCTQRINAVKIKARNERWPSIPDGQITPACAQACPTSAIVFGDLNDPNSAVRKLHEHPRSYALLGELNTKPRTSYLAKLRNPAEDKS